MKKIIEIAKNEISLLFYSPIAWLLLIVFIGQSGFTFIDLLSSNQANQELGNNLSNLTVKIFGDRGVLSTVKGKLYLYVPLLTMGLLSKEYSSGSIKLLYSSPITPFQIVLGKFFSMVFYGFILCLALIPIVGVAYFSIEHLDISFILGGVLGLFLLLCTYSAIGLYMSSMSSYQVVSAISTLAILAALNFVNKIGQGVDFFREITYWLSISGRTSNFIHGVINSKDIIYFILVIGLFLTLTTFRLQKGRIGRSRIWNISRHILTLIIVLGVGYISSLPASNYFYDTTRFKQNTLTKETKELIKQLDSPLQLTTYVNILNQFAHLGSPKFRIFERNQFERYLRYLPDTKMNYVAYYDSTFTNRDVSLKEMTERARKTILAYDYNPEKVLSPEEIRSQIDLKPERNLFVRKLTYKDRNTNLRMFFDQVGYPKEAEISAGIKRLIEGPATIKFLSGQRERGYKKKGDKSYRRIFKELNLRGSLINQGFEVSTANIDSIAASTLTALVIADPQKGFLKKTKEQLSSYIEKGGNMILTFNHSNREIIRPLIKELGVDIKIGQLLEDSPEIEKNLIQGKIVADSIFTKKFSSKDIITLPQASALTYKDTLGFQTFPLIRTRSNNKVWNRDLPKNVAIDTINFRPQKDHQGVFDVGLILTRQKDNKTQKIVLIADPNLFSNGEISRSNVHNKNFKLATEILRWMSGYKYPIDTSKPKPIDNMITKSQGSIAKLKLAIAGLYPLVFLLIGGRLLIRRKRK